MGIHLQTQRRGSLESPLIPINDLASLGIVAPAWPQTIKVEPAGDRVVTFHFIKSNVRGLSPGTFGNLTGPYWDGN